MRMIRPLGLALVVLAIATTAHAQLLNDPSTMTCRSWTTWRAQAPGNVVNTVTGSVTAWFQGYLEGAGQLAFAVITRVDEPMAAKLRAGFQATVQILHAETIPKWLDAYCTTHADETLGVVATGLLNEAYQRPLATK